MNPSKNTNHAERPWAVIRDDATGRWLVFPAPERILVARTVEEVMPLLQEVENAVEGQGLHAAGCVSYEAAPACDACLSVGHGDSFPLAWFGLSSRPAELPALGDAPGAGLFDLRWRPSITAAEYGRAISAIKVFLQQGESYQVNFTYRLRADCTMEPFDLFLCLTSGQAAPYSAYLDAGDWVVCSASPELFFRLDDGNIQSRPMKGTAARGLWFEDDLARADALRASVKERAENVMIVDMVRNDLGRIARAGSVRVPELFAVHRYPTLWQMTSLVTATTRAGLPEIFQALFPPASITGAPKARTMQIIAGLEDSPRRIYTGCVGFLGPGRKAQFNVAIRTVLIDARSQVAEYGTGGGVVWDSASDGEYRETLVKARVVSEPRPAFDLLETLLWSPGKGWFLLERHLRRMSRSAAYFGFSFDRGALRRELAAVEAGLPDKAHRVRLLVSRTGACRCEASVLDPVQAVFGNIAMAARAVDRDDPYLYHKTTHRQVYEEVLGASPGCSDVLLFNQQGEVTESTVANTAFEINGVLCTPPVRCGLLPGTFREDLLERAAVVERVVHVEEALQLGSVYLMNSLRGMHRVKIGVRPEGQRLEDQSRK